MLTEFERNVVADAAEVWPAGAALEWCLGPNLRSVVEMLEILEKDTSKISNC